MTRASAAAKRAMDMLLAASGLLVFAPVLVMAAILIKMDSDGPVLFKQQRIGRKFRPFEIYKFRTMVVDATRYGGALTVGNDPRVTRVGRILRQAKLDELPQLVNVLKGEMSFVGPRPEVPRYVEQFRKRYETILSVRPGITDMASLKYRDESAILGASANPEEEYVRTILPDKLRLAEDYIAQCSLVTDLKLIVRTVAVVLSREPST